MHKSALVFAALAFVAFAGGCSVAAEAESTGETSAALDDIGTLVTVRRLVRKKTAGCETVFGDGGKWLGAPVASSADSSDSFCAYSWTSTKPADLAKLDEVAKIDTYLGKPFNVNDPRPSNDDAPEIMMTKPAVIVSPLPITSPGGDPTPRSSGCDVCVVRENDVLWFVLPPEAFGHLVYVKSGGTSYSIGKGTEVAAYADVLPEFTGTPILTW